MAHINMIKLIGTNPVVSLIGIVFLFSAKRPKNCLQKTELHVASKYLSLEYFCDTCDMVMTNQIRFQLYILLPVCPH